METFPGSVLSLSFAFSLSSLCFLLPTSFSQDSAATSLPSFLPRSPHPPSLARSLDPRKQHGDSGKFVQLSRVRGRRSRPATSTSGQEGADKKGAPPTYYVTAAIRRGNLNDGGGGRRAAYTSAPTRWTSTSHRAPSRLSLSLAPASST